MPPVDSFFLDLPHLISHELLVFAVSTDPVQCYCAVQPTIIISYGENPSGLLWRFCTRFAAICPLVLNGELWVLSSRAATLLSQDLDSCLMVTPLLHEPRLKLFSRSRLRMCVSRLIRSSCFMTFLGAFTCYGSPCSHFFHLACKSLGRGLSHEILVSQVSL